MAKCSPQATGCPGLTCIECMRNAERPIQSRPMIRFIEVCNPQSMDKETLEFIVKKLKLAGAKVN